MKILALPVDDTIADGYNNAAPEYKAKINSAINLVLAKLLKPNRNSELFEIMEDLSDEAGRNGMTIKTLAELMEWDDDTVKNLFGEAYK